MVNDPGAIRDAALEEAAKIVDHMPFNHVAAHRIRALKSDAPTLTKAELDDYAERIDREVAP